MSQLGRVPRLVCAVCTAWTALSILGLAGFYVYSELTEAVEAPTGGVIQISESSSARASDEELAGLIYRYFPSKLAQEWEEVFIRDYFQDKRFGFFVDVGANHYKVRSTTYYIDKALGWSGLAIDPITEFAADYAKQRPRTKFLSFFVSEKSEENVDFFVVVDNPRLSSGARSVVDKHGMKVEERKVRAVSLTELLDAHGVKEIDLLKMDIEMWEPPALRGFDIDRFKPKFVVIEFHEGVRNFIRNYFRDHGYALVQKYTKWDSRNAYFIPKEDMPAFLARKTIDEEWQERLQGAPAAAPPPAEPSP